MTDTVNVPQEMIDAVMKVAVGVDEYGSEVFPGPFVAAELVGVALAAAPKAEPVSDPYKFEDEVKWLREAARYFSSRDTRGEDRAHWANVYNAENANKIADRLVDLMSSHPTPDSDELLEAAEALLKTADHEGSRKLLGNASEDDQWIDYMEVGKIELDRLQLLVDQHKGPQS